MLDTYWLRFVYGIHGEGVKVGLLLLPNIPLIEFMPCNIWQIRKQSPTQYEIHIWFGVVHVTPCMLVLHDKWIEVYNMHKAQDK